MTALTSGTSAQEKSIVHLRGLGTPEAANAATVIAADHYSYSRLNRYATCPLSFKLHYLDALPNEPAVELQFGTLLHRTLEALVREHVRANRIERIGVDDAVRAFRREWSAGTLSDPALFADGLEIVKRWALDRVDRVNDDTIRVRDYKSHRVLFAQDEVDASLQLSLYDLAARQLWPWAKHVELELDMVRHGVAHRTSRGDDAREATREYVLATVAQIEGAKEFPATPHTHCNRCDQPLLENRSHAACRLMPRASAMRCQLTRLLRRRLTCSRSCASAASTAAAAAGTVARNSSSLSVFHPANAAVGLPVRTRLESATHASQIWTPGPATSLPAARRSLRQKEHRRATSFGGVVTGMICSSCVLLSG